MDRLGFSQEEKDWAALLYSTLAEDQNVTLGDSDGDGYYNDAQGPLLIASLHAGWIGHQNIAILGDAPPRP